jgi:Mrp family chromosome partitioning ATPase
MLAATSPFCIPDDPTQPKNFIIVLYNLGGDGKSTTDLGFEMIKLGSKLALIDFNP